MARRKKADAGSAVSLFPFLSILACVIGTLTLMITALALGQMDNPAIADQAELDQAQRAAAADEAKLVELQKQLQQANRGAKSTQQELAASQATLKKLRDEESKLIAERAKMLQQPPPAPPAIDVAKQKKEKEALAAEIATQQGTIKELNAEIKARGEKPEEAVVSIRPGGSGVGLEPTFVECTRGSIVIHNDDQTHRVRNADLSTDKTYLALLDRIAAAKDKTVIFLVREDALSTYFAARKVAQSRYARNGKLPVIGQGKIDLSLFR